MSELPRAVDFLLGDNGDEKFPRMATSGLLHQEEPVILVTDLHAALEALAVFIPTSDVDPEHLMRIDHAMSALEQWAHCSSDLLEGVGVLLPRAVAILWSPEYDYLAELANSKDSVERALVALADVPGVHAGTLWADADPIVRAAVVFGHGAMCPSWNFIPGEHDANPLVNAAVENVVAVYRSDDPSADYACRCQPPSVESASAESEAENVTTREPYSDNMADAQEKVRARFRTLSEILHRRRSFMPISDQSAVAEKLLFFYIIAETARATRERCRDEGLPVDAYNDEMVNYELAEIIMGSFTDRDRAGMDDGAISNACALARHLVWLTEDSLRHDHEGDWAKRLSGALATIAWLHPEVREEIAYGVLHSEVTWPEWMMSALEEDSSSPNMSLSLGDSTSMMTGTAVAAGGASILNFHQAMWLQEGDSPLSLSPERDEAEDPNARTWGDQLDFELYLAEAWHARRTDDWSFFIPLVRRAASVGLSERWSQPRAHALYNALNHLLLFGGDGQHPIAALGELLDWDDEYNHLGGFTNAFKDCWRPVLLEMWLWWTRSGFAPHARAGTLLEWVDQDLFGVNEPNDFRFDDGDALHLSGHCGAPLGQHWTDSDRCETDGASILRNEPTVVTVTVPTYRQWMAVLRTMTTSGPTIVKVMISDEEPPSGVTLGFWLVQKFEEPHPTWRNHVRFLTDATAPTALSLVREWQWNIPGSDPVDEA